MAWTLNGLTFEELGVTQAKLEESMLTAGKLTLVLEPDDATVIPAWAAKYSTLVIADGETTIWRGDVATVEPAVEAAERLTIVGRDPWQQLADTPLQQTFKKTNDPTKTPAEATLVDYTRGRVILGQDDTGARVNVGQAIAAVIAYAAAQGRSVAAGTITIPVTVAWDELEDLSCLDAIQRLAAWVPDALLWWDYSADPPQLNGLRASTATAVSFAQRAKGTPWVAGEPYAPITSTVLNRRDDLQVPAVKLVYIRTDQVNGTPWELADEDIYPAGSTGGERCALVRTIQLAGAVTEFTVLEQPIQTIPLDSYVRTPSIGDTPITSGAQFDSLAAFWKRKEPQLTAAGVTIKSFRRNALTSVTDPATGNALSYDGSYDAELVGGQITDWMETNYGKHVRNHSYQVEVEVTASGFNSNTVTHHLTLTVTLAATNASTTTYRATAAGSYTPAESMPDGLAQVLYEALSALVWEGSVTVVDVDPPRSARVGNVLNLTGSLTAWATMRAVVQSCSWDIFTGRQVLQVGPAAHLGPTDLVSIWRATRRKPATSSWAVRTTGRRQTATTPSGSLGKWAPTTQPTSINAAVPTNYTVAITPAGALPTVAELQAALATVYPTSGTPVVPVAGDHIDFTVLVSSQQITALRCTLSLVAVTAAATELAFNFMRDSVTWGVRGSQTGLWPS